MTRSAHDECVYEISVVGELGPVLRQALEPCRTAGSRYNTILRVVRDGDEDVTEMVRILLSLGLEVTTVSLVS